MLQRSPQPIHHHKRIHREQLRVEKESASGSSVPDSDKTNPREQHY
jgi:hypothetical protein